jgi:hypothetical protein
VGTRVVVGVKKAAGMEVSVGVLDGKTSIVLVCDGLEIISLGEVIGPCGLLVQQLSKNEIIPIANNVFTIFILSPN